MNEPDTKVIEQTLRIRTRPETVRRDWTDRQRMCHWLGQQPPIFDPRPGGTCRIEMGDAGDTIMTLRHTGIHADHAAEHRAGWAHFLPILADAMAEAAEAEAQQ